MGGGDLVQGRQHLPAALGAGVLLGAAGAGAVDGRTGPVLAGQEARGEGEIRDGGQALAGGEVLQRALVGVPGDQVVVRLEGDVAGEALAVGKVQGGLEALGGDVGGARG
ncbi:hypothetical protein GCM10018980_67060 [Streptomyces capoamus]|uniref:Uncharacterized protein n=1 Tax=Streptomyces capoamus TaxID=68183 RepID=A0A919KFH4_9ACTN|nr:hypothetical protein GCM10018980_67060 [Streptomyces capoamus]